MINDLRINTEWLHNAPAEEILEWLNSLPSNIIFNIEDVQGIVKFFDAFAVNKSVVIVNES